MGIVDARLLLHRLDWKGRDIRLRQRATPSRAWRLLGLQARIAFQLSKASSGWSNCSNNVANSLLAAMSAGPIASIS